MKQRPPEQNNVSGPDSQDELRYKSAFDLVALALAGGVTVLTSDGSFDPYDVMIGAVLLILLSTRDTEAMPVRAYSAVWALLWVVALGFPLDFVLLALSQVSQVREALEWLGQWLRVAGYLPSMDSTANRDWLAAYRLVYTTTGFAVWYALAASAAKHRDPQVQRIVWWR